MGWPDTSWVAWSADDNDDVDGRCSAPKPLLEVAGAPWVLRELREGYACHRYSPLCGGCARVRADVPEPRGGHRDLIEGEEAFDFVSQLRRRCPCEE